MKTFRMTGFLFLTSFLSTQIANGQIQVSWITYINYQQSTVGSSTTMDIHVGILQPGTPGFPCQPGTALTVDSLILANSDVTSSQDTARVNIVDLLPTAEPGGYVYHLPVGTHFDLPTAWQAFNFKTQAHCP